ncbi:TPA: hypothetical protein ACSVTF_004006, partial [Clostridioides difficile]
NIELKNSLPIIDNNYKVVLGDTSYILKNNNTLWGSGNNEVGQLGLDDIANRNVFTRMTIENIRDIACGDNYIIVLKNDDTIWGTGNNNYGQLGLDSTRNVTSFNQLNVNVEKIICGKVHTFIMKKDKTIWGTGNNDYGQL